MSRLINIAKETTFSVQATHCTFCNFEVTTKSKEKIETIDVTGIMISPQWIEVKPTYFRSQIVKKEDLKPKQIKKLSKDLLNGTYYLNIRDYTDQELKISADFLATEWTNSIWSVLTAKDDKMTITLKDEVVLEQILKENQDIFKSKSEFKKFVAKKGLEINDFIVPGDFSKLQIKLQEISIRLEMEQFFARRFLFTETLIKKINNRLRTYIDHNETNPKRLFELKNWMTELKENNKIYAKYEDYQKLYEMPKQTIHKPLGAILKMTENEELIPPKPDKENKGQQLSKGVLSGIPFAGGFTGELLDMVWRTGYEKRLSEWRTDISIALSRKFDETNISTLLEDEEFQSLLAESTIIAIKNHQEDKLNAIKNLLINSTSSPVNYDFKKLFLNYLDQFTMYHLRTIGHIYENLKPNNKKFLSQNDHIGKILDEVFHGDEELRGQVFEELMAVKGLITKKQGPFAEYNTTTYYALTTLGQKFIKLVLENDSA